MTEFEKLIKKLDDLTSSANTSCSEFTNLLMALGFQMKIPGKCWPCEKSQRHPASVPLIEYPNYNCGHNRGEAVKRPYIKKLYKFVKQHEEAIKEHLK